MSALGYACQNGHTLAAKVLIENGGKKNVGFGNDRLTPLCAAAAYGHYELAEYLITEGKANVCGKDKFKRTPLILAIMNGQMKLASLLLQYGAEWNGPDSSNNTPLHYAAGYGWRQAIDFLVKAGANINAENSWRCTPINIAILKNHFGVVKKLLENKDVNVNGKDEEGRTLITLSLLNISEETEEFVEFLIKEKGGDPNIEDVNGFTPLHHLVNINVENLHNLNNRQGGRYDEEGNWIVETLEERMAKVDQTLELHLKLAKMLLKNKANLFAVSKNGQTPFGICLKLKKFKLIDLFIQTASFNKDPQLLFEFCGEIFDPKLQDVFRRVATQEKVKQETMNVLDKEGFTPFLRMIQSIVNFQKNMFIEIDNFRRHQKL